MTDEWLQIFVLRTHKYWHLWMKIILFNTFCISIFFCPKYKYLTKNWFEKNSHKHPNAPATRSIFIVILGSRSILMIIEILKSRENSIRLKIYRASIYSRQFVFLKSHIHRYLIAVNKYWMCNGRLWRKDFSLKKKVQRKNWSKKRFPLKKLINRQNYSVQNVGFILLTLN